MISINGRIFTGNNVTFIGQRGMCINIGKEGKVKRFDEAKWEDAKNIEKIVICSETVDVNVSVSNSSKVESHFYGQANIDGNVKLDVSKVDDELRITLMLTGNCYNGDLKLDVILPRKIFKVISIETSSADTILGEGVSADYIKAKSQSGDFEIYATFNNILTSTMSGDVELCINAKENISAEISTMSGDVSADFNNIGHINLSTHTMSGDVRNRHKGKYGYTANVHISTMSGDINVK